MRLKNFEPSGHHILVEVRFYKTSLGGLLLNKPEQDLFGKIVKAGPLVTEYSIGDLVLFGDVSLIRLPFEGNKICVLATDFQIIAKYVPDKDEKRIFVISKSKTEQQDSGISMLGDGPLGEWAEENNELIN